MPRAENVGAAGSAASSAGASARLARVEAMARTRLLGSQADNLDSQTAANMASAGQSYQQTAFIKANLPKIEAEIQHLKSSADLSRIEALWKSFDLEQRRAMAPNVRAILNNERLLGFQGARCSESRGRFADLRVVREECSAVVADLEVKEDLWESFLPAMSRGRTGRSIPVRVRLSRRRFVDCAGGLEGCRYQRDHGALCAYRAGARFVALAALW